MNEKMRGRFREEKLFGEDLIWGGDLRYDRNDIGLIIGG